MAGPSKANALTTILDAANFISGLLGTFSTTPTTPAPPRPQPKAKSPPLALPRVRTLHLPLNQVKIPSKVVQEFKSIYLVKVKQLRRVAQEEYTNLCKLLPGPDLPDIARLLRTSYRASEDRFAQLAIDACLDAFALASSSRVGQTSTQVKKPFDRAIVAIFEYIFDRPAGNYITMNDKHRLAYISGMSYRQITVWFQNRRARTKQKIHSGKLPEPMTLDKAMVKLRADCEKARLNKIKAAAFQELVFRKIVKVPMEEEGGQSGTNVSTVCSRDQQELDLRHRYATGALPNLDALVSSPGTFPRPFAMPVYAEPYFEAPVWPRTCTPPSSKPFKYVTKLEVESLANTFDDVVELQKTKKVVKRRRVTFALPLPPAVQAAVARRDAAKLRGKKGKQVVAQPNPVDEANRAKIQAITSNAEELLKFNLNRAQVQITGSQVPADQPYMAPPSPPTVDDLVMQLEQADLDKQHSESDPSGSDQDSGTEFWDDSMMSEPLVIPSLSSVLAEDADLEEIVEVFLPDEWVATQGVNPTDYPPVINTEPECIPLDDILMDSYSMNEALKMTLKELDWKGPLPANIDEPFVFNYVPSFANPIEPCLAFLNEVHRHQDGDIQAPENAATMDVGGNVMFDPITYPVPVPLPPSASAPYPDFPLGYAYQLTNSADTGVLPDPVYDSEGVSLPFTPSDPASQSFFTPGVWGLCDLNHGDDWDGTSMPFVMDPTLQIFNVDTSADPTFDQCSDPQGSALPFASLNQEPPIYSTASDETQTSPVGTMAFYDQIFPDSYMFFAPPPPEPKPPAEPPISFYPSYLPQVPLLSKEAKRAGRSVLNWLERTLGLKTRLTLANDPEEMLQYLA